MSTGTSTGPGTDTETTLGSLTVLYDATCPLCARVRGWLEQQEQLVPLRWVPCGSPEARALLPGLDHTATTQEITVVADTGQVWTAEGAWITCLWATAAYRGLAHWLSHPRRRREARAVALGVSARRPRRRPGSWTPPRPVAPPPGPPAGSSADPGARPCPDDGCRPADVRTAG